MENGKTLRRSHDQSNAKSAIHMVSARACANGLVLGQTKTDEKSNEITAIPELLKMLEIEGCIVTIETIDAGHGKIEVRKYWTTSDITWLQGKENWENLKTICMVERERQFGDKAHIILLVLKI